MTLDNKLRFEDHISTIFQIGNKNWTIYLKERYCLWDKFSRFSPIFAKFAKLNSCKIIFFSFLRISKTYIFTLGSPTINDGHVKNILQVIMQSRIKSFIIKIYIKIYIEKFGQEFHDSHTTSWRTNHKKMKIYKTLIKLTFAKNPRVANSRN